LPEARDMDHHCTEMAKQPIAVITTIQTTPYFVVLVKSLLANMSTQAG
jgi:hypothetical protein